jgi:predicted RNA-binding protein with PIN domain
MHYLIDGHNLIPQIPGLHLAMLDDEQRLLELLQAYCGRGGHQMEVYFDNAPPSQAGSRRLGRLTAHFIPQGQIADDAIRQRLVQLGRRARGWTVVSTDQRVQVAGREAHAIVMRAEDFARQLLAPPGQANEEAERAGLAPGKAEVEEWLRIFEERKARK